MMIKVDREDGQCDCFESTHMRVRGSRHNGFVVVLLDNHAAAIGFVWIGGGDAAMMIDSHSNAVARYAVSRRVPFEAGRTLRSWAATEIMGKQVAA